MEPTGRKTIPLIHDGRNRPYVLQLPQIAGTDPLPLLLELHGRVIDATRFDRLTGFGSLVDEAGFVLAMPSAVGELWNDGRSHSPKWVGEPDDVGYLDAVIGDASGRAAIDPARIYVVGMSNGAVMAGRFACERAERIAAVAQVAGTASASLLSGLRPGRPVPILNIHGAADRYAPYEGGIRHGLRARVVLRSASRASVGIEEWARFWVAANGALEGPAASELAPDTTIRIWQGPSGESDVVFYRIEGGGHTWPGSRFKLPAFLFGRTSRTFDATRVSWEFLARHDRHRPTISPDEGDHNGATTKRA
jgi:polyhydroxybutyrate depolymerase